jgi:16S rRNA (guanine527-N7)-methyltransferase
VSRLPPELAELRPWLRENAVEVAEPELEKVANYLKLLTIWAKKLALVSAGEIPLLVRKHLADCLYAASRCPLRGRAADLGSGAGLPGIPVAILRPELAVDLIESRAKKISFLTQATHGIANARPLNRRVEDLAGGDYSLAIARALAPLQRLLPLARPLLTSGGTLIAMKSERYPEELDGIDLGSSGFRIEEVEAYRLPTKEQRILLTFRAT